MNGNFLYFAATCLQLFAFTRGCDVGLIGLSIGLYGVAIFVAHSAGWLQ